MDRVNKQPAFLLKVGDGGTPPAYATIAGLRQTRFEIDGVAATAGTEPGARLSVTGSGIFTGSAAETRLKGNALSGAVDDYELSFESGDRYRARFLITRLDYAGDYNGERTYNLALESAGKVDLLPAKPLRVAA